MADEPAVGGAQLVDVALDRRGPFGFCRRGEPGRGLLGFGERPSSMTVSRRGQRMLGFEAFETVVADGV